MPRRPAGQSRVRAKPASPVQQVRPGRRLAWLLAGLAAIALVGSLFLIGSLLGDSPERLRGRAEAAARSGDWVAALDLWRTLNATKDATGLTHLGEARACLALGRARQAEQSLRRSIAADPADPEPWRLLLQIFQVENRTIEALHMGWEAIDQAGAESGRVLLRELTLSLLADLPDERMRITLRRWIDSDGEDVDARIALLQRIAVQPRADDPDRARVLAELESILAGHPDHIAAREVLVTALADAGEPNRGRALLDEWPTTARDPRYWRLRGAGNSNTTIGPRRRSPRSAAF